MKLSQLSNQELESRLKELVTKERQILHVILEHIKEVDTRRLYLERAYSSIYEYLVKELHYSGSAAMRRLEAARLLKEVPTVAQKIQEGSLNLSQIGELSRAIKENEKTTGHRVSALRKKDLVSAISGKTIQETQKELCVILDIEIKEQEKQRVQQDESVRLQMTLSKIQYQKLSRCRDLAGHLLEQNKKDSSWVSVIEVLADQYLNGKDFISSSQPVAKTKTAVEAKSVLQREPSTEYKNVLQIEPVVQYKPEFAVEHKIEPQTQRNPDPKAQSKVEPTTASETGSVNKSLTPKVRREILARDKCCQFTDSQTGRVC